MLWRTRSLMFWRRTRSLGMLLLAIWLIATGVLPLLGTDVPWKGQILSLLAIAAGVLILLERP